MAGTALVVGASKGLGLALAGELPARGWRVIATLRGSARTSLHDHDDPRTLLLINPGHVRTELGGPSAPLTIEESIPGLVDTITAHAGEPGLRFLDHHDETVTW